MRSNEGKCCDAVVRLLESQRDSVRRGFHFPDKTRGAEKGQVDACGSVGTVHYVLEHTRIEPFEKAIGTGKHLCDFMRLLDGRVSKTALPGPALYEIKPPLNPRFGGAAALAAAADDTAGWIHSEAASLHDRALRAGKPMCSNAAFAGLAMQLLCTPMGPRDESTPGEFGALRDAPESVERRLVPRLEKALADKCPKLRRCQDRGARTAVNVKTALILEKDDQLSNHISIRQALNENVGGRADTPDEIYLIDTSVGDDWYVFPMNAGADKLFECGPSPDGPDFRGVRSLDLEDLGDGSYGTDKGCEICLDT